MILSLQRVYDFKEFTAPHKLAAIDAYHSAWRAACDTTSISFVKRVVRYIKVTKELGGKTFDRFDKFFPKEQATQSVCEATTKMIHSCKPYDCGGVYALAFVLSNMEIGVAAVCLGVNCTTVQWMAGHYAGMEMELSEEFWRALLPEAFHGWEEIQHVQP